MVEDNHRPLVMKFGGSSLATPDRIATAAALVHSTAPRQSGTIVVVSAMGGVTDRLFSVARTAQRGPAGRAEALEHVSAIEAQHISALDALEGDTSDRERIALYISELRDITVGVSLLGELTPRSLDAIVAYGEKLSAVLFSVALRAAGSEALAVSAENVIVTDTTFGNAAPRMQETRARAAAVLRPLIARNVAPVVTGYIGATLDGATTTLGRNGSDYSAAIIGAAVDAVEIWIWTDVDGVMSADPRLVSDARSLRSLSYAEASELAYFGSKVLHPRTIVPAIADSVPIRIKNTFNPRHSGTLISARSGESGAVKAVTIIHDLALIAVEGLGMLGVPGIAGRTFGTMATAGVNVLMISQASSESNIAFVVAQRDVSTCLAALRDHFAVEIQRHDVDAIRAHEDVAILTIVGTGMRGTPGVAGRLFSALGAARVNVIAIAQGSSEQSISCVIQGSDSGSGLRATHDEFIGIAV